MYPSEWVLNGSWRPYWGDYIRGSLGEKHQRQRIMKYVDLWGEVPNNNISPCDNVQNERLNHGRVQLAHVLVLTGSITDST